LVLILSLESRTLGWEHAASGTQKTEATNFTHKNAGLHSWGYTQKTVTQVTPEAPTHPCLLQHYSQ
jgi:hypothetical protein